MKNFYMMALAALVSAAATAQISVTFRVDMSDQDVSVMGVHVAGSWQAAAGFSSDWQPGESQMSDAGDGIYELTVDLPAGQYEYKYVNGNDWGMDEAVPGDVAAGGNRFFAVTVDGHAIDGFTLPAVKFGEAAPEGMGFARLSVDMALQEVDETGVHIAGDVFEQPWTPAFGTCFNTNADVWTYVVYNTPGSYLYKFVNGDDWGVNEWPAGGGPDECTDGSNRTLELTLEGVVTPAYCYNTCETCSDPNVLLTVDMSNVENDNGGFVAGDFNGWAGQAMANNDDGTYSIELFLEAGATYEFKFQNGPGGWEGVPVACQAAGSDNRTFTVPEDLEEGEQFEFSACINQCTEVCVPNPDPANVTFRVDMNAEDISAGGVFIIGTFTDPVWQAGAIELTDPDGDGVYEVTVLISGPADFLYKYVNGDVSEPENEEFNGFPEQLPCNVSNNFGGWNRFHTRSGEDEVLPVVPFAECLTASTNNVELGAVNIYPNPSFGSTFVEIENPNGYNLRMNIMDVTGKIVRENILLNTGRKEINTSNFAPGLYLLNVTNERSERAVYKLMVR